MSDLSSSDKSQYRSVFQRSPSQNMLKPKTTTTTTLQIHVQDHLQQKSLRFKTDLRHEKNNGH